MSVPASAGQTNTKTIIIAIFFFAEINGGSCWFKLALRQSAGGGALNSTELKALLYLITPTQLSSSEAADPIVVTGRGVGALLLLPAVVLLLHQPVSTTVPY